MCSNVLLIRVLAHLRPDCDLSLSATQSGFSPVRQDQSGKFGCLVLSGQETHMLSPVEPYYHFYYKMCFPTSDDCAVGTQQIPVHDSRKLSRETKNLPPSCKNLVIHILKVDALARHFCKKEYMLFDFKRLHFDGNFSYPSQNLS